MKILYAAHNNLNGAIQLSRFINAIQDKNYTIKIAAYRKSSPPNVSIDWTLDAILNISNPKSLSLDNNNFNIYFEQIKYYKPDLIISDMEYFTSYIAGVLNIPLWQCSSSLINDAISNKYDLGLYKQYSFILNKNNWLENSKKINILENSEKNFIYSHLGDTNNPPQLKNNFEWIRPYHVVGKISPPCAHNIVAALLFNNKNFFKLLKPYQDSVIFTNFSQEFYSNPILKSLSNTEEYFCNLKNSHLFVCEGQTSFLADAFYNNKYSAVWTNFEDTESIINSVISEANNLSTTIHSCEFDLNSLKDKEIKYTYNDKIQYLHQKIENL